jgi:two-component system cell cycle response regulator
MSATILVVDDLAINRKLLEVKLLSEYYIVLTAKTAERALEILKTNKIDIILLDIMMPGIDGISACRKIKEDLKLCYIPIILITALSETEDRVRGFEAGADEFLTKPINDIELFARVKSLTRMKLVLDKLKLKDRTNQELGFHNLGLIDDFSKTKIVIFDDNIIQSRNIANILKTMMGEVYLFDNLKNFEAFIQHHKPDIVIISCQISNVDPLRISGILMANERLKYTFIILMAEDDKLDVVFKGVDLGINDYLVMPIDNNELIAKIKTQLRKKIYIDSLRNDIEQNFDSSVKDVLTDTFNRRYFDIHIEILIKKAIQLKESLFVMILDIDDFKLVNDRYGHQVGDLLLKIITNLLKYNIRITDLIARYGGDEFIIILPNFSINETLEVAERLKRIIENTKLNIGNGNFINKTISIGIAEYRNQSVEQLINETDIALYKAKHAGKNKIKVFNSISNI